MLVVVLQELYFLGYYTASSGNFLLTFRDNVSVPSYRVKMRPKCCPETSVRNYHYTLRNNPEEHVLIFFAAESCNRAKCYKFLLDVHRHDSS